MDKYLSLSHRLDYILIIYCWAVSQIAATVQSLEICAVCTSRGPAAPTNPQASCRPSLTSSLSIPSIPITPSITSITSITNPQAQGRPSLTSSLVLFLVQLCYGCSAPHLHFILCYARILFWNIARIAKSPLWQINVSRKKSLQTALLRT